MGSHGVTRAGERPLAASLAAWIAAAFVRRHVVGAEPSEVESAAAYVDESLRRMPDVNRAGVAAASCVASAVLAALGRSPFSRQSPRQQEATADRLARLRLPAVSELSRLSRGLALVAVYERRSERSGPG